MGTGFSPVGAGLVFVAGMSPVGAGLSWGAGLGRGTGKVLMLALIDNKVDFVKLLLDPANQDIDLREFLTIERLCQLYNNIPKNSMILEILSDYRITEKYGLWNLEDVGKVVQHLVGDFYQPLYLKTKKFRKARVEYAPRCRFGVETYKPQKNHDDKLKLTQNKSKQAKNVKFDFEYPWRELYLWALLLHRLDLAEYFWTEGNNNHVVIIKTKLCMRLVD